MTRESVFERLTTVFHRVFDDPNICFNENTTIIVDETTTADDIEDWDSFENINLIAAVEEEFSFEFPMGKVASIKNVGEMVDIILEMGR